ncbi:hypothetical protein KIPB_014727, partial [Kipferlia bialata]
GTLSLAPSGQTVHIGPESSSSTYSTASVSGDSGAASGASSTSSSKGAGSSFQFGAYNRPTGATGGSGGVGSAESTGEYMDYGTSVKDTADILTVEGNSGFSGDMTLGGGIDISGNSVIHADLAVEGALFFNEFSVENFVVTVESTFSYVTVTDSISSNSIESYAGTDIEIQPGMGAGALIVDADQSTYSGDLHVGTSTESSEGLFIHTGALYLGDDNDAPAVLTDDTASILGLYPEGPSSDGFVFAAG